MPLKITLKPNERVVIGGAVITNGKSGSDLIIENNVPVLREKDIISEKEIDSHCKRIYFTIQLMYIDEKNIEIYHKNFLELIKELIKSAPSTTDLIEEISKFIIGGNYYQALKTAKKLIDYEQKVIAHVRSTA
jgi:flagellar protein FlbT